MLFGGNHTEDERDSDEEEVERSEGSPQGLAKYGVLNIILAAMSVTNETLSEQLEYPIAATMTMACYKIDRDNQQRIELEKWRRKH